MHLACEIFGNTILKKTLFSDTSRYLKPTTDDFAHILEQTYHLVFTNLGTENQNVTNPVIAIV